MIVISVTLIEEHYLKSQEMTQEPEIVTEEDQKLYKILYDIYDCYFSNTDWRTLPEESGDDPRTRDCHRRGPEIV